MYLRTVKTSSGAVAVQVVEYVNRKRIILTHLGSAKDNKELESLKRSAHLWIEKNNPQKSLFPAIDIKKGKREISSLISIDKCSYLGFRYNLFYEVMSRITHLFKFHLIKPSFDNKNRDLKSNSNSNSNIKFNKILSDLVIIRLLQPDSKVRSLEFLEQYFGINHDRRDLYRHLEKISNLKDQIESKIINFAKKRLNFDFSLVFYDLTTIYFESFKSDELRKNGFSKDNKINQPQIMIGLLVNKEGFPISHQIFEGNKFEGHTLIPVISKLLKKHKIDKQNITIVADAAMISKENINFLIKEEFQFIVGARIANLNEEKIDNINNNLNQIDNNIYRIDNEKQENCHLITHFSNERYRKDKHEIKKQLIKAKNLLSNPDPSQINKRSKFLTKTKDNNKEQYQLNDKLIEKSQKLLGIKGYYTNLAQNNQLNLSNRDIINKYRNLWQVEKSFRISKSDLKVRPIYHYKDYTIRSHIIICFMALAIAK